MRVIYNGIAIPETSTLSREALLAEVEIPVGSPVIGFIGRMARQKRCEDVIFAMALVAILRPDAHLLMIGEGPERDKLMKFAREIGIDHLVRFTGHCADAAKFLHVMDVFWLASDFEGSSNSLMEAMAAGVPCIASDIPPNRELVVDGETGFLVRVGDRVGFQQFTDRLLGDAEMARRMGDAGRERMRREFSIGSMVDAHAKLYREVVLS